MLKRYVLLELHNQKSAMGFSVFISLLKPQTIGLLRPLRSLACISFMFFWFVSEILQEMNVGGRVQMNSGKGGYDG